MMKRIALGLFALMIFFQVSLADAPFRNHRFDSLKVLPECSDSAIIFIGNSITNMMEWNELFGDRVEILNRGVSGAFTGEVLYNLDEMIKGTPKKVFLMIGTNDLGTEGKENSPEKTAGRIGKILDRMREKWPETTIYYQSILPSKRGLRTKKKTELTNALVKKHIERMKSDRVRYLDIYNALNDGDGGLKDTDMEGSPAAISFDGLHLSQRGYQIWADMIREVVGYEPVIPAGAQNLYGGLRKSEGMRASYFGALPVKNTDILLIGDEMIHGGEWIELTGNPDFKDRGIGWGVPSVELSEIMSGIELMLNGNENFGVVKETPRAVVLYGGLSDILNGKNSDIAAEDYGMVIDALRANLPDTPIYVMTVAPYPEKSEATALEVKALNDHIRHFSEIIPGVVLIELEKALTTPKGTRDEDCFMGVYLSGKGYMKVAQVLNETF